jgi:hypothetical protein
VISEVSWSELERKDLESAMHHYEGRRILESIGNGAMWCVRKFKTLPGAMPV